MDDNNENIREDSPKIYPINTIADYKKANDNLRQLQERYELLLNERQCEDDETERLDTAVYEQKKQLQGFGQKYIYDNSVFSDNLNVLLDRYNLQVGALESLLEVSAGYISRTLGKNAKKRLSVEVVWKIANIFNITVDDLVSCKLSEPTNDMKKVLDFIIRLKSDIENEKSHWLSIDLNSIKEVDEYELFFKIIGEEIIYKPIEKDSFIGKVEEIFKLDTSVGVFYLVKGDGVFKSGTIYEIYQFDRADYLSRKGTSYELEHPLLLIAETFMEKSRLLYEKCDELYKTIKTHEFDFTISSDVRSVIDRFMETSSDFMDIPKDYDLPFKK